MEKVCTNHTVSVCRVFILCLNIKFAYFLVRKTVWSLAAAMPVQWNTPRALTGLGACGSTYRVDNTIINVK
jgi:hypothetical protein